MAKTTRIMPSRLPSAGENPSLAQPKIWVDGCQRTRFDVAAFLAVSLTMTRRLIGPMLTRTAPRIGAFGARVASGKLRPNLHWMGRAERIVPSHQSVGTAIRVMGRIIAQAATVIAPPNIPEALIAYPNLIRPTSAASAQSNPLQTEPRVTPTHPLPEGETLRAIRLMIGQDDLPPARNTRPVPPEPKTSAGLRTRLARLSGHALHSISAQMIVWGLLVLAFPVGAAKALIFHFDGGNLADWD